MKQPDQKANQILAVIYGVLSSPDDHESVVDQQRIIRDAIGDDARIIGVYGEANQSGFRKDRGPQLEAAIRTAVDAADEHGQAELWVFHSTRLGRGTGKKGKARALGHLLYQLQERGVSVRSVGDDDFTTNEQLRGIASRQASKYSEDLSVHTTRGIHKRQRAGKPFGGMPCGYKVKRTIVDDDEVRAERVIDPATAPTVEAIYSMIEAGRSWGPIARELNARGLRTRRGNPWTAPVVRDLAKSRIYRGEQGYPALIDPERWDRIQSIIDATTPVGRQRKAGGRPLAADGFLVRGVAFCQQCGSPMHVRSDKAGYYTCRAKRRGTGLCDSRAIPAQLVDERVLIHLDTFLWSVKDWIAQLLAERNDDKAAHEQAVERERAALRDLERVRGKLLAEYERHVLAGRSTAYLALEAVERKDGELDAARRRIADAEAVLGEWAMAPDADAALDFYSRFSDAIRGRVSGATGIREVNEALSTMLAGIWLSYDGKRLEASFSFTSQTAMGQLAQYAQAARMRYPLPPAGDEAAPDIRSGSTYDSTSIQSVPSRRSEFSTSRTIQRRELPNSLGSSPIEPCTLVARTTLSRLPPASALPTISSEPPRE